MPPADVLCPACRRPARLYCAKPRAGRSWHIYRCAQGSRTCGHAFVHPRPALDEVLACNAEETATSPLTGTSPQAALGLRDVAEVVAAVRSLGETAWTGRMLDVGAGDGAYAAGLSTLGLTPHLIDLDPRIGDAAALIPHATAARETFENLSDRGPYRMILMSQVLEHALDPHAWLRRAKALLTPPPTPGTPGGLLVVLLPNFGGIYRLLGARDPYLIPPVHVNYFTAASLRRMIDDAGLTVRRIDSDTHVPFSGGLARRTLSVLTTVAAPLLRGTTRGIILRGFAHRTR